MTPVSKKVEEEKQTEEAKSAAQIELEKEIAEAQSKVKNLTEMCLEFAAYLDEVQMKMGEMQSKINKLRVTIFTSIANPSQSQTPPNS